MTMPALEVPTLKGSCRPAPEGLRADLSGSADLPVQLALSKFMTDVHVTARTGRVGAVELDLKGLKFMSSSCFKVFVTWLTELRALPEDARYRVKILSNPAMHWQRRSLLALAAFGGELVEVVG